VENRYITANKTLQQTTGRAKGSSSGFDALSRVRRLLSFVIMLSGGSQWPRCMR
jgi:hypothetical protein